MKQNMVYLTMEYHSVIKKEKIHATKWMNLENFKWENPDPKGYTLYDSIYMKCLE